MKKSGQRERKMECVMEWRREYEHRWAMGGEVEMKQDGLKGREKKRDTTKEQ